MATLVAEVATIEDAGQKGHVLVQVRFVPRQTSHRTLCVRKPPALPKERLIGPLEPQVGWDVVGHLMATAREAVGVDADEELQMKVDEAYAAFANAAELAIVAATGAEVAKLGCRAARPRAVWHSVLPEKVEEQGFPLDGVLHAFRNALSQAYRIHSQPRVLEDDLAILEETERVLMFDVAVGGGEEVNRIRNKVTDVVGDMIDGYGRLMRGEGRRLGEVKDREVCLEALTTEVDNRLEELLKEERRQSTKSWEDWLRKDVDKGARNAHQFSKIPTQCLPTAVKDAKGTISSDPEKLLDAQRRKYQELWGAADKPVRYAWPVAFGESQEQLPTLTRRSCGKLQRPSNPCRPRLTTASTSQPFNGSRIEGWRRWRSCTRLWKGGVAGPRKWRPFQCR